MIRIMLACAQGLSTSLLVTKMQEAAAAQGVEAKIWATSYLSVEDELGNFDVLLLGPQVRHAANDIMKTVGDRAKVAVIRPQDYGRCDGKGVLNMALKMAEEGV